MNIVDEAEQLLAETANNSTTTIEKDVVVDKNTIKTYTPQELVEAFEKMGSKESFLLLGHEGYIYRGWTTLLSGYAKSGKTTLLAHFIKDLPEDVKTLFIVEEPPAIWGQRIKDHVENYHNTTFLPALNSKVDDIISAVSNTDCEVIIIDTIRNLLRFEDENNNSEIVKKLVPVIGAAQAKSKTLILTHHTRKGGGQYGEGAAGAGAFMGIVDVGLEIRRDSHDPDSNRREIHGQGRIHAIEPLTYELSDDDSLKAIGSPKSVKRNAVRQEVLNVLNEGGDFSLQDIKDLVEVAGREQVRLCVNDLVNEGLVDKDTSQRKHYFRLKSSTTTAHPIVVVEQNTDKEAISDGIKEVYQTLGL